MPLIHNLKSDKQGIINVFLQIRLKRERVLVVEEKHNNNEKLESKHSLSRKSKGLDTNTEEVQPNSIEDNILDSDHTSNNNVEVLNQDNNTTYNEDKHNPTEESEPIDLSSEDISDQYDIDDFIKDMENEEIMADVVPDKNEKSVAYEILMFIRDLAIMLVIFGLFTTFIADRTSVIGDSMEPTIHDGDYFVLNKVSYRFTEPERFDIVVFPYNHGQSNYIKRIIGLPGETIELKKDGESYKIYINGEELIENYGKEPIDYPGNQVFPFVIPEDEYFVMGDNRNDSSDSRYQDVGTIPESEIIGKAGLRVWPLDDFGFVD